MDWTHRLRLRNLKMLLSLDQTRNISHSAAMLNTTQPGLSKWLKDLEDDIGLPLFERHARGLRPTPHGDVLIAHARRVEAQLDRAGEDMAALREGGGGRVVIGASGASASDTVPLAVMKLLERMPQARVKLVEGTTDRLLEQLAQGGLDIVVGRSAPEHHDPAIRYEALYLEPIHLVARPRHPLFAVAQPDWPRLLSYRWILWPRGTPIRNALDAALAAAARSRRPTTWNPPGDHQSHAAQQQRHDRRGLAPRRAALRSGPCASCRCACRVSARWRCTGARMPSGRRRCRRRWRPCAPRWPNTRRARRGPDMPASRRGLNALIEQCRRLEAELDGAGSRESTAMHRFVAEMDAHRAPPGMVAAGAGGADDGGRVGVGLGLLSLLPLVGAAAAAFALVLACAATALVLAIGVVAFMGGHAYGLVLLRRLALGLAAAGALGLIAWTQGDMRAVGPALALSCGLGAWLVLDSSASMSTPATGWRGGRWTGARPPALTAPAVPGAAVTWRCWTSPWTAPPPGASAACGPRAPIPARLAGRFARLAT